MENKIAFKKKLITIGTSKGIIIERSVLEIIGLKDEDLDKDIMLKVTIERADAHKQNDKLLARLAGEKMKRDNVNELTIKLKSSNKKDEEEDETNENKEE